MATKVVYGKPTEHPYVNLNDFRTARSGIQLVGGAGLLALGSGVAYSALSKMMENAVAAKSPADVEPDSSIQTRYRNNATKIRNSFLNNIIEKRSSFDKRATVGEVLGTAADTALGTGDPAKVDEPGMFSGQQKIQLPTTTNPLSTVAAGRNPRNVYMDTSKLTGSLNNAAAWMAKNPVSIPLILLPAATAAIYGGFHLGKGITSFVKDRIVPKPKRTTRFYNNAVKEYASAAEELRDTANSMNKEGSLKDWLLGPKGPVITDKPWGVAGKGSAGMFNLGSPWTYAAALGAYLTYKGLSGFKSGFEGSKKELAHNAAFNQLFRVAQQRRDPEYNELTAELLHEPKGRNRRRFKDTPVTKNDVIANPYDVESAMD